MNKPDDVGEVTQTEIGTLADRFLKACARHKILVATAESCTGGLIIAAMTDIPGSSSMVDRGFVTYSNDAKMEMLGVRAATLEAYGAVSSQTAREMAIGALARAHAGIALAVTGIAGPDGGSAEKPVGLVWFGLALKGKPAITESRIFENNGRDFIRRETCRHALDMGLRALDDHVQADGSPRP
jgi:nicotinamide-nucleotide amidase